MIAIAPSPVKTEPLAAGLRSGHLFLPISKLDEAKRIVWGVAQVELANPDSQGDIVDFDGSVRAFKNWAGNVREMHQPIAAGRAVSVFADPDSKQILVGVHVSRGAQNTWEKVRDGTLAGFSIAGHATRSRYETHKGKRVHRILDYELDELSLVDVPANSACKISLVEKRGTGLVLSEGHRVRVARDLARPRTAISLLRR